MLCFTAASYILQHNLESRKLLTGGGGDDLAQGMSYSQLLLTCRGTCRMLFYHCNEETIFWGC